MSKQIDDKTAGTKAVLYTLLGDVWQTSDRPFKDYPQGTKAQAGGGGHWIKNERGWKWCNSHCSFPTPGGDWNGMVSLPNCT